MPTLTGAVLPAKPYPFAVPVPAASPTDSPLICVSINRDWIPYVVGALSALKADSTWDSDDENVVAAVKANVDLLIEQFAQMEACPMPIQFQVNPADPVNWQYSFDGGTTWLDGPDTAAHYTPTLTIDGGAPGGYDLSVNGGETSAPIPLLTAFDPEAIIKDPATAFGNAIVAASGVDGLIVGALAHVGVILQSNGISAQFQKVPGLGLAADTVVAIKKAADYTYPLLALLP